MQKFPKVFTLMSAIFALTFCAVSCKTDDDDEPTLYTVTVASSIEHGKVSVDKSSAGAGTTIKLTATADEGYQLDSYSVKDASSNAITVTDGTFAMPKSNVTVSATFKETAETVNKNAANAGIAKISAIGTVTYTSESKAKIDEARTAYDALTEAQKALVPAETLALLTAAETKYAELKAAADSGTANQNAADAVIAKITAIGTVAYTSESKTKIDAARSAYDALTSDQKALVTNYSTLTTAESSYESLAPVRVTAITLNKTATEIKVGSTETLSVTAVAPENATDKTYTWKTSDATKATVTAEGVVTAVAEGTVTIYAEANDGSGVKGNCTVTVTPATITVTAITLNKTATEIKVGSTETLSVTAVAPENATDKTYTWKTSDATKATVTAEGVVTAVAEGTVTIYAEANDGSGVKGNCTVTVQAGSTAVLSGALVDGATIKVNFNWRGNNAGDYVQGVYNAASGTFTVSKGGSRWGGDSRAVYKVEKSGDNIIIGAGIHDYYIEGMVWTFNTTNDTYTTTNGDMVNDILNDMPGYYGLISVTLNGTNITSQLTNQ